MDKIINGNIVYLKTSKYKTNKISLLYVIDSLDDYEYLQILTNILYSGSKKYKSKKEINNYVEDLYDSSITLGFQTYGLKGVLEISVTYLMDKYANVNTTKKIIDLLDSILNEPLIENGLFKEEYLEREKRLIIEALLSEFDNKSRYSIKQLTKNNSVSDDFKNYANLTINDVENITNEKLVSVYHKYIKKENLLCYVMGEVDLAELDKFKLAHKIALNGFTRKLEFTTKDIVIEETKEINQTVLTMCFITNITYLDEEKSRRLTLLNHILGGDSNSLLFRIVREEHNLCYSIYSTYNSFNGTVTIVVGLDDEAVDKCIDLINETINSILNNTFSDLIYNNAILSLKESILDGIDSQYISLKRSFMDDLFNRTNNVYELIKKYESISKEEVSKLAENLKKDVTYILRGNKNEKN